MNQGSSDRIPASSLILFASIIFTVAVFLVFRFMWSIPVPPWLLAGVLGLQLGVMLLGSSKVLTQLGAASLSALLAVAASVAAVFLLFPPSRELRVAGAVGGGSALLFILASFVAASRADPVPAGTREEPTAPQPLSMGDIEDDPGAELIRYGEVTGPDEGVEEVLPLTEEAQPPAAQGRPPEDGNTADPGIPEDRKYEFDGLSESSLGRALGSESEPAAPVQEAAADTENTVLSGRRTHDAPEEQPPSSPSGQTVIPEDWVEEAARAMAHDLPSKTPAPEETETDMMGDTAGEPRPAGVEDVHGVRMRTRYKVLDAVSGEHYGTYYGDEGYSALDPGTLTDLLGPGSKDGELRIARLDWSNFDEVEVHISFEEVLPFDVETAGGVDEEESSPVRSAAMVEPSPEAAVSMPAVDPQGAAVEDSPAQPTPDSGRPRYVIYDRRTIQPMGEYIPEGDRPRIDRLTLYRMFPDYNFRTFEIDSVRWEGEEVRIFIKGEKKDGTGPGGGRRRREREPVNG